MRPGRRGIGQRCLGAAVKRAEMRRAAQTLCHTVARADDHRHVKAAYLDNDPASGTQQICFVDDANQSPMPLANHAQEAVAVVTRRNGSARRQANPFASATGAVSRFLPRQRMTGHEAHPVRRS